MGRPKKEEVVSKVSMGEAFVASIADKIAKVQTADADSQKALTLATEKFVFDGYVAANMKPDEDGFTTLQSAYHEYCDWTGKHIAKDDFLALVAGSSLKLVVIHRKDIFAESAVLAIAGIVMNNAKGDVIQVKTNDVVNDKEEKNNG